MPVGMCLSQQGPLPSGGVPFLVFPQQGLMSPACPVLGQQFRISQMMSLVEALVKEKTQGAPAAKSESSGLSLSSDKGMDVDEGGGAIRNPKGTLRPEVAVA